MDTSTFGAGIKVELLARTSNKDAYQVTANGEAIRVDVTRGASPLAALLDTAGGLFEIGAIGDACLSEYLQYVRLNGGDN